MIFISAVVIATRTIEEKRRKDNLELAYLGKWGGDETPRGKVG